MSADNFRTMVKPPTLLLVVSGAAQGTRIAVPLGGLVIGRSGSPDGRLGDDPALSRRHAVIVHSDRGELVVSDLGSSNGTFLNGSRVDGSELVSPGDIIELGNTKLQAIGPSLRSSPAAAAATRGGAQSRMTPAPPHPAAAVPGQVAAPHPRRAARIRPRPFPGRRPRRIRPRPFPGTLGPPRPQRLPRIRGPPRGSSSRPGAAGRRPDRFSRRESPGARSAPGTTGRLSATPRAPNTPG